MPRAAPMCAAHIHIHKHAAWCPCNLLPAVCVHPCAHLCAVRVQARGYDAMPEEREEIEAEKRRRADARRDVVSVEKARAKADVQRSKFHQAEEDVSTRMRDLDDAKRKLRADGTTVAELEVKRAELVLRATQEDCIAAEAKWLALELRVESQMVTADIGKAKRYAERNKGRERIERVRA